MLALAGGLYILVSHNMKHILLVIIFLSSGELFSQELKCLNVKYYRSDNDVIGIRSSIDHNIESQSDSLQLIIIPNSYAEFPRWTNYRRKGINRGFEVHLVNNSSKEFNLANMDGRVIIQRQVYYKNKWKSVKSYDRTPRMICGNSYFHDKFIESGQTFTYAAPCLNGSIKAKFRFVAFGRIEKKLIYSNEFQGYISKKLIE